VDFFTLPHLTALRVFPPPLWKDYIKCFLFFESIGFTTQLFFFRLAFYSQRDLPEDFFAALQLEEPFASAAFRFGLLIFFFFGGGGGG